MSIETQKKRLTDFLAERTAVHEANKRRADKHHEATIAQADATLKRAKDQVESQIAALDAAAAAAAEAAADAHA
jgi:hypothetical protein